MWIGIEATTASSALLLIIDRQKTEIEAAWRYVLIVSTGLTLALISVILIYLNYHTLNSVAIIEAGHSPSFILTIAGATALVGFGTKIGIFPMHTWLPDAHGEAPSEISAMFSGILLPVAAYVLYRFFLATYTPRLEEIFLIFILATLISSIFFVPKPFRIFPEEKNAPDLPNAWVRMMKRAPTRARPPVIRPRVMRAIFSIVE